MQNKIKTSEWYKATQSGEGEWSLTPFDSPMSPARMVEAAEYLSKRTPQEVTYSAQVRKHTVSTNKGKFMWSMGTAEGNARVQAIQGPSKYGTEEEARADLTDFCQKLKITCYETYLSTRWINQPNQENNV
jgi:hypothetical protein